ncbi:hypothetical protein APHAL10511_004824 [Amanita phalloides]|nr:hypothetical protein APHAL10511_004824 [Amanita phalloides]
MNFFDTYELTTPVTPNQPQQSLNEEVAEVMGQIGRFWGTFRKQSQTALEIAGGVVNQAQTELNKLATGNSSTQTVSTESGSEGTFATPADDDAATATNTPGAESSASSSSFFSRFQSVIPPNIASTVRSHLPETLKHASENLDFAQLQTKLMAELQRVQGLTRTQAEEYVHKSESLLREAVREAGVVIRDAVKIVPPEEAPAAGPSGGGVVWDGTDMWMLPPDPSIDGSDEAAEKDKTDRSMHQAVETERAVATRAEALVRRLKHDPSIIRHDPESDEVLRDHFHSWVTQEVEAKGGIEGSYWSRETAELLEKSEDGPALQKTRDTLVPSEMSQEIFWKRFFFRVHQISLEEERRKALIESTTGDSEEEDLSWGEEEEEEEEEEAGSPTTISPKKRDEFEIKGAPQLNVTRTSSWEGSEASYDVVSNGTSGQDSGGKGEESESDWE